MDHCGFAHPGTYGHECGAPAVKVGLKRSAGTANGIFYARRCAACAQIKGGENIGVFAWEQFNPAAHVNHWTR